MVGTEQQARTRERKRSDALNYRIENLKHEQEKTFFAGFLASSKQMCT